MPWTTRFSPFLLCGASWLFPPAVLITAPILAVAIVVCAIAEIVGAFRGHASAPAPPSGQSAEVDPSRIPFDVDKDGFLTTRIEGNGQVKALSVKQPWAELIACGEKTIEVRGNCTKHRGPLLIVSCKSAVVWATGCAAAVVDLVDCRPMTRADEGAALGALQDGASAWVLENPLRVEPALVRSWPGIFNVRVSAKPGSGEHYRLSSRPRGGM